MRRKLESLNEQLRRLDQETAERFRPLADERRAAIQVETPSSLPLETDRNKVERVLDNLVTNAFKFMGEGGAIRLTARTLRSGDDVDLAVELADIGPGIAPEDRERVFDRFHQVSGSGLERMAGGGLGLAIVRDFVHLLGGTVELADAPDLGGALFTVRIPAREPANETAHSRVLHSGSGGEEALRILTDWKPDAVLADLMMPEWTERSSPPRSVRARA